MTYRVGVTRKTNRQVRQWKTDDGYTSRPEEAKIYENREQAAKAARAETDGKWRGEIQTV